MSRFRKRTMIALVAVTAIGSVVSGPVANAAPKPPKGKVFSVKARFNGAPGMTAVLLAKTGRVLASKTIPGPNAAVSLATPRIQSLTGASLHLVGSGGDYFGPVVLGWTGKTSAKATRVSTTMASASTKVSLGVIKVQSQTANQGVGIVAKKYAKSARPTTRAVAGVPIGVGSYGKSIVSGVSANGAGAGDAVRAMAATYNPNNVAPGADADLDGIVNAFDVNDDNDEKLDFQDENKPAPKSTGVDCVAASTFSIFSNFKATDPNFVGTINHYGTGAYQATLANIGSALTSTLTFAVQRISTVCGEAVVTHEFKGVNVPYAPTSFVQLPTSGNDVQWSVGSGTMNGAPVAGLAGYTFNCASGCPISGQDTFVQRVTTTSGAVYEFVANPGIVFVTHPMIRTIYLIDLNYGGGPITGSQTLKAYADVSGVTPLSLKVYRPQRLSIEGESAQFFDIGGLQYVPDIPNGIGGVGAGPGRCDQAVVTDMSMPTDTAVNSVSPPVLTFSWDMSKIKGCFEAKGLTWTTGVLAVDLQVSAPVLNSGNAAQKIYLILDLPPG